MKLLFLLISILTVGLTLRLAQLNSRAIWFDEQQSVLEANGIRDSISFSVYEVFQNSNFRQEKNFANMVEANIQRDSGNGILHTGFLYYWSMLFGNSAFSVRIISVLFSVSSIVLLLFISQDLGLSKISGYISAMLFSLHHMAIMYAQEARPYAMATFFILLSATFFIKIIKARDKFSYWLLFWFGVFSSIALLVHYLTVYILLGEIVIAIVFIKEVRVWRNLILGGIITALILSLWMYTGGFEGLHVMALRNSNFQKLSALDPDNTFYGQTTFKTAVGGIFQMLVNMFGMGFQDFGLRIRDILPLMLIVVALLISSKNLVVEKVQIYLGLIILMASAPVYALLLAITSHHTISFQAGYSIFSVPFVCIFMGLILEQCYRKGNTAIRILVAAYSIVIIISGFATLKPTRHGLSKTDVNMESLAKELENHYTPGDTLAIGTKEKAMLFNLYFSNPSILQKVDTQSR